MIDLDASLKSFKLTSSSFVGIHLKLKRITVEPRKNAIQGTGQIYAL